MYQQISNGEGKEHFLVHLCCMQPGDSLQASARLIERYLTDSTNIQVKRVEISLNKTYELYPALVNSNTFRTGHSHITANFRVSFTRVQLAELN